MKKVPVYVSEPVYRDFIAHAKQANRTTAELIREAMELFRDERIRPRASLTTLKPLDLGRTLRPLGRRDDLLGEMLCNQHAGEGAGRVRS